MNIFKGFLKTNIRKEWFLIFFSLFLLETNIFSSMYGRMQSIHIIIPIVRYSAYVVVMSKLLLDYRKHLYSSDWLHIGYKYSCNKR